MDVKRVYRGGAVLAMVCLAASTLYAGWWDTTGVPEYPDAQEVRKETRSIGQGEFEFVYYTSQQDAEAIKAYYREKLQAKGWNEKELAKDMSGTKGLSFEPNALSLLSMNLVFMKEKDMILVNFMPDQFIKKDGLTRFVVAQKKRDLVTYEAPERPAAVNSAEGDAPIQPPEVKPRPPSLPASLTTKFKKEVVPPYPDATILSASEDESRQSQQLFVRGSLSDAVEFYKSKMSVYAWELADESVSDAMEIKGNAQDLEKLCPTCPQEALTALPDMKMQIARLRFKRYDKARCEIVFSHITRPDNGSNNSLNGLTTITVSYDEKKK